MPYDIIKPPFTLKFREMSKQELKAYYAWFFDVMPERIEKLSNAVKATSGFESWSPDETIESLELLGDWFAAQVEVRPRASEEIERIRASLPFPIDIPNEELTIKTFSLAMDIGMYFGRVFLSNHPSLKWHQFLTNKNLAEYGRPALVGFGKEALDPVGIMVVLAYRFVGGRQNGERLKEIYKIWSERISEK